MTLKGVHVKKSIRTNRNYEKKNVCVRTPKCMESTYSRPEVALWFYFLNVHKEEEEDLDPRVSAAVAASSSKECTLMDDRPSVNPAVVSDLVGTLKTSVAKIPHSLEPPSSS